MNLINYLNHKNKISLFQILNISNHQYNILISLNKKYQPNKLFYSKDLSSNKHKKEIYNQLNQINKISTHRINNILIKINKIQILIKICNK